MVSSSQIVITVDFVRGGAAGDDSVLVVLFPAFTLALLLFAFLE
jgi:hypothetical protein